MDIIHKIDFFPFLDAFFTDTVTYNKLTNKVKMSHYFMTMRTLAIMNPMLCHSLNKIQSVHVLDSIQKNVGNQRKKPDFVYTSAKAIKAEAEAVDPFSKYDTSILSEYAKYIGIEFKDLKTFYTFTGDALLADVDSYVNEVTSQTEAPKKRKAAVKDKTKVVKKK